MCSHRALGNHGASPTPSSLVLSKYAQIFCKIPIVWDKFLAEAENEHTKALETYRQAMPPYRAALRVWESGNRKSKAPAEPKKPVLRMQAGEDVNFLRFATLLKILVGSSITEDGLDKAEKLLQEYLLGFLTVSRLCCFCTRTPNIVSVVWCRCHEAKSPLGRPHSTPSPRFRPVVQLLGICHRTIE